MMTMMSETFAACLLLAAEPPLTSLFLLCFARSTALDELCSGSIPVELGMLTRLQYVNLGYNGVGNNLTGDLCHYGFCGLCFSSALQPGRKFCGEAAHFHGRRNTILGLP